MLVQYRINDGKLEASTDKPSVFVYTAPDEEEKRRLVSELGLDEHDLRSALDQDEIGRLELLNDLTTVILKTPRNYSSEEQLLFSVTSVGLFLKKDSLVIVTTDSTDLFDDRTIRRLHNVRDVMLKVLYSMIARFLGHLKVINMLSESLEKRVNASMGNRYLLDMFTLEKSLVYFVNGIASNQMVLEKMLAAAARIKLSAQQRRTLDDIVIENLQCSKQAEIYTNILTGLMDARGSVVNNNLSVLMKKLTVISVIFMPMNVLASMGGMSEFSDWTRRLPWWISYPLFLVLLVLVGLATFWVLRRTGLERDDADQPPGRRPGRAGPRGWLGRKAAPAPKHKA